MLQYKPHEFLAVMKSQFPVHDYVFLTVTLLMLACLVNGSYGSQKTLLQNNQAPENKTTESQFLHKMFYILSYWFMKVILFM